ncbi:Flp pilus assembly complex ATPase component TadA [Candidatus Woesearchaeota archaeon]|nr:Flp pilus assembly complex ATPase component TadA [Candidatus Woesearchaeota archaeon]
MAKASKEPSRENKQQGVIEKLVPDTSVIIEGMVSRKIKSGEVKPSAILIHEAVIAELEHQANMNKTIGFLGLDEIKRLKELSGQFGFSLEFAGLRPHAAEIRHAKLGEIDALIRQLAFETDGTLMTADKVQAEVSGAKNIPTIFVEIEQMQHAIRMESYFDEATMSVHLRENVSPKAKKGMPGNWTFKEIDSKPLAREEVKEMSREIIEEAGVRRDGFVEIERQGSTIVQLGPYRIVITRPPLSDGWEITAVRPVKKLSLEDYKLSDKLKKRIDEQAEGVLIAGSPGHGKSTFATALAEHYALQDKIVKTVEAPRDLLLPDTITQYAISHGSPQEIHDILLLSRPDYTIFDEMRNTADFQLFADLRLAGIGLAGVVHATNPIDAIQRFVGRIELGVIPQIIDTVIFIRNGFVGKILSLNMTVKVPEGMTEADLARPVVVVNDFETGKLEYELYSYGEETVVIPVSSLARSRSPIQKFAATAIEDKLKEYVSNARVEMASDNKCVVYVPEKEIARLIGREGKNIAAIEERLGVGIDVQPLSAKKAAAAASEGEDDNIAFDAQIGKKHVVFSVDGIFANKNVKIYADDDYVMTANVGKDGIFKISRKNKIGKVIADAVSSGSGLKVTVSGQ